MRNYCFVRVDSGVLVVEATASLWHSKTIPFVLRPALLFSLQYYGLVRHRAGIEAWTKQLVLESYPAAKDVKMLTNRSRDRRDF